MLLTAACDLTGPKEYRRVGHLWENPLDALPDSIPLGSRFAFDAATSGGSCVRGGDTEVSYEVGAVEVTPYDYFTIGTVCLDYERVFDHPVTLQFPAPGPTEVRLVGRESGYSTHLVRMVDTVIVY